MELERKICYINYRNILARWCMVLTLRTEEELEKNKFIEEARQDEIKQGFENEMIKEIWK